METYPLLNENGEIYAFNIPRSYFFRTGAIKNFFKKCPGVKIIKSKSFLNINTDTHVVFELKGKTFSVDELFGDNSMLWVGPKESKARLVEIDELVSYASSNWPGPYSKLRAKVISLFK